MDAKVDTPRMPGLQAALVLLCQLTIERNRRIADEVEDFAGLLGDPYFEHPEYEEACRFAYTLNALIRALMGKARSA
jgi:hypothetical protein